MKRVLVNALSVTNQSGESVLCGHLRQCIQYLSGKVEFLILCRENQQADFEKTLGGGASYTLAPDSTRQWWTRAVWERRNLSGLIAKENIDTYFTPSGFAARNVDVPQIVFCQNPWAFVPSARRFRDHPKAWLQRATYRQAMKTASVMVFNSRYMQEAYRLNAGHAATREVVVYQAPSDQSRASSVVLPRAQRKPGKILSVSAWGRHKNIETTLKAVQLLVEKGQQPVELHLAGFWPTASYEAHIRSLIESMNLREHVHLHGYVSREELNAHYSNAQVFCLMSRCESFGIPAVEAHLFGTPVVSSNVCAIPEICGEGGVYAAPDDVAGVADALERMLSDEDAWQKQSTAAKKNADQFTWETCSRPLVDLFLDITSS